eukprot:NODE_236_length_1954_cov_254.998950_g186_i0.p1 GENE.NODE_236_length_1954_cov_254.998950_g186_i0~~NODE_236_length_1954_cov_254.998950_g186_i0.p1  ORF type:complete len:555 (-),score=123.87 NODE_236_length_1954_cov_254.998950_g186_i0:218-1882(-)
MTEESTDNLAPEVNGEGEIAAAEIVPDKQNFDPPENAPKEDREEIEHPEQGFEAAPETSVTQDGAEREEPLFVENKLEIKCVVLPEGFVHYVNLPSSVTIMSLYNHVSRDLRVEPTSMRLSFRGQLLPEHQILSEISESTTSLVLNLELEYVPRHLALLQKYENVSTVLPIQMFYGEGIPPQVITVVVVKGFHHKQFMGGFRNKKTYTEYHHAVAQTDAKKKEPKPKPPCYSRDTQTAGTSRSQQTKREAWTQMARPGLDIDTSGDRIYRARPYFSAQALHELRVLKSIRVQAHIRGWFARRLARRLREEEEVKVEEKRKEEERQRVQHEAKRQKEIQKRTHPRTAADFSVLYNELEAWTLQEATKIKESDTDAKEKGLARQELLKKQTKLLQTIDKLQIKANVENKKEKTKGSLAAMAAHKNWKHSKPELGQTVVETPFTVRAKELLDLYNGMQMKGLSVDERLDILLHVKWTVKEFECALTREIVELIDREADLLNRGRKEKQLEGLRQRMSNLFLQFCETPEFNPEAINHQRVPLEFTTRPLVKLDATKKR